ncbi:MAG TPA: arsenic transporter [Acidobacteriaceae bacterium]|nr:arsenic transporter [Acidobacteriaceae bacterium]
MSAGLAHVLLLSIVAASLLLMLLRPKNLPEVYWVGAGAVLLVALRLVPLRLAARAVAKGTDVYLFLIGMMLLSELARENGVFDWLSSIAVSSARGSCSRLFAWTYAIGTAVTVCMSNDATAVVLTPAILAAVRRSKVQPLPYLFACAMVANAASFFLPIANPANLVVFQAGVPPLGRWLAVFLLPSVLSTAATFAVLRWYFRRELRGSIDSTTPAAELDRFGRIVLAGIVMVVLLLLLTSALHRDLGPPTCLAALAVAAIVCVQRRSSPLPLAREISWTTLALVAALFVMVDAVASIGALHWTQAALRWLESLPPSAGAMLSAFLVGAGNNVINNLPMGLIAGSAVSAEHTRGLIANAVLIGVDLGPNLSVTGSLATILWLIALRREKLDVSFVRFLRLGAIVMPVALAASVLGLLCMHLIFPAL